MFSIIIVLVLIKKPTNNCFPLMLESALILLKKKKKKCSAMVASANLRPVPNKMGKIRSRPDNLSELKKEKK